MFCRINKNKWIKFLLILVGLNAFVILGCTPPPQAIVTVLELSTCQGWDKHNERPIGVSEVFSSTDEKIMVCGRLESNMYDESRRELVYRETIYDVTKYFFSTFTPTYGDFEEGNYSVEVIVGKLPQMSANFKIEP